ncbi:MAG: hypothetical protein ABW224_18680 [Kibdelosporangium sp.]
MDPRSPAAHRTILVLDVEGFGSHNRTNKNQLAVRHGLREAWQEAFDKAGITRAKCAVEDRGDGIFLLAPAEMPKAQFVDAVPLHLAAALRAHNAVHPREEQIRLRMALHAGEVEFDDTGATGAAILHAFRLLNSRTLREALGRSSGVLALITSDWFYHEVVKQSGVVNPADFREVRVSVKETNAVAWITLPDQVTSPGRLAPWPSPSRFQPLLRGLKASRTLTAARTTFRRSGQS